MTDLFSPWQSPLPALFPPEQRRFIGMISVIGLVTALYHALAIPLFFGMGLLPLAWFNLGSVLVWIVVIFLSRQGRLYLPALLIVAEIGGYVALCSRFLGWESGAPFLLFNLGWAAFAIPISNWFRLGGIALAILEFVLLYFTSSPGLWNGPAYVLDLFWLANVVTVFAFGTASAAYLFCTVRRAERAQEEAYLCSERLLHNVLPPSIAARLQEERAIIADFFPSVSILFADIAGFTPLSQSLPPVEVVALLNALFSSIDDLVHRHGLEKIKTIGDAYMVAAGLPQERSDHADAIVSFALELLETLRLFNQEKGQDLHLRIGINSGPVTAGVIGRHRLLYDLWGDSVNVAARMESHGRVDAIHVSAATRQLLQGEYGYEERGMIPVKGKGEMRTYFVCRGEAGA